MIFGLNIFSPKITLENASGKPVVLQGLKKGQLLGAKVLGLLGKNQVQLLVAGRKMAAKTDLPLKAGDQIQLKVVQNRGGLSFKLVTADKSLADAGQKGQGKSRANPAGPEQNSSPPLKNTPARTSTPGQQAGPSQEAGPRAGQMPGTRTLQMQVAPGREAGAKAAPLKTALPGTAGISQATTPGTSSTTAPPPAPSSAQASSPFSNAPLARLAASLFSLDQLSDIKAPAIRDILMNLALKSGTRDESFLPRLLENQGLSLENKIATLSVAPDKAQLNSAMNQLTQKDLKAALLNLIQAEEAIEGGANKTLVRVLKSVSTALEGFQQLNTQAGDGNRFLLPFPVLAGEQFDFGQLLIDTGPNKDNDPQGGGKKVIGIAFLLEMSVLGRIRADFSVLDKAITGRFLVQEEDTCTYMKTLMPELKTRLEALGYQVSPVQCQVAQPRELAHDALVQSITDPMDPGGFNLIV